MAAVVVGAGGRGMAAPGAIGGGVGTLLPGIGGRGGGTDCGSIIGPAVPGTGGGRGILAAPGIAGGVGALNTGGGRGTEADEFEVVFLLAAEVLSPLKSSVSMDD